MGPARASRRARPDLVFTRMLAGPLDFHQGACRSVPWVRNEAREVTMRRWSWARRAGCSRRTLFSRIICRWPPTTPRPTGDIRGCRCWTSIPATWDDTKVLDGAVGRFIVSARRQGKQWWRGAMTDREERTLKIPLGFLGPGQNQAKLYATSDPPAAGSSADQERGNRGRFDSGPRRGGRAVHSPVTGDSGAMDGMAEACGERSVIL